MDSSSERPPAIGNGFFRNARQRRIALLGIVILALSIAGVIQNWPSSRQPVAAEPSALTSSLEAESPAGGVLRNKAAMLRSSPGAHAPAQDDQPHVLREEEVAALDQGNWETSEKDQIAGLMTLVQERCGVRPTKIATGNDAYTIEMPLGIDQRNCLDAVALQFDRDYPNAPQLVFDPHAAASERNIPVLQVSMMHAGVMPYVQLRDGRTLFVGAIVDGWTLSAIDDEGAEFRLNDRTFRLVVNQSGDSP